MQYVISGSELVGYALSINFDKPLYYDERKDRYNYPGSNSVNKLLLAEGDFIILFPDDCHKPMIRTEVHNSVRKVVIKIDIKLL